MSGRQEALAVQRVEKLQEKLRYLKRELEDLESKVKAKKEEIAETDKYLDIALDSSSY